MALIEWDDSYSVNVKRCDEEHQKLFSLLNGLHEAMRVGKGRNVVGLIIEDLNAYTKTHFTAEEGLLRRAGYPALDTHRAEYQKFIAQVAKFQEEAGAGRANSIAVVEFLKDWLAKHIKQTDRLYSAHLNAKRIN